MLEPEFETPRHGAVHTLDRWVTGIAVSTIAVLPTLGVLLLKPQRLAQKLTEAMPDGNDDRLLAPGALFPLSLIVTLFVSAMLTTPETLQSNAAFLGPGLAIAVQNAAASGDFWGVAATVLPIYGFAIGVGLVGGLLSPFIGPAWTLRTSVRAGLYATAGVTAWIILSSSFIDILRVRFGLYDLGQSLYAWNSLPIAALSIWMYFGFIRALGDHGKVKALVLAIAMLALILMLGFVVQYLVLAKQT
ncbi:MAG: hypothetical protein AAF660_12370 [Pseudomonadota bacterium]